MGAGELTGGTSQSSGCLQFAADSMSKTDIVAEI